jgi:2-polyprenyl-3-methyl-5-hydroxy-6-metoxy-1,4-benzoquinol methylase
MKNEKQNLNQLKKNVTLPQFLDNYIFEKLKASFAPDYKKFNKNLRLNKEDVLIYLGTYFPRSFTETYSVFNNILQNEIIKKSIIGKNEINILDIGSGTGGNLSGLLLSLIENKLLDKNVNVVAIDGNKEAQRILEKIVFQIQLRYQLNISLSCHYVAFETITDLYENSKQYFELTFDFIISSKLINEIISKDQYSYLYFYKHFAKFLNDKGLLLMLDVMTKIDDNYMPILLNSQTNRFIQKNKGTYQTLIPTSCAEFDNVCKQDCFTNNHFSISHTKKKNDRTKVTYRIIGRRKFVKAILSKIDEKGSVIGWDNMGNKKLCKFKISTKDKKSAYKI